jgi:uncharacterized sporulation protein YeaH/YhbH (DUF444 family)
MRLKIAGPLFLFVLLQITNTITAQGEMGTMPPGGMPERKDSGFDKPISLDQMLTLMTEKLQLDELQQLEVRVLLLDQEKERSSFGNSRLGERPNFEEMREKMEAEKNKMSLKLKKILNKEQFKQWADESAQWKPEK